MTILSFSLKMTNLVRLENLKCVEWTVQMPTRSGESCISRSFSLLGRKCHLECSVHGFTGCAIYASNLCFKSNTVLHMLPLKVTVRVALSSEFFSAQVKSVTSSNQKIWSCSNCDFRGCLLTFEVIIHIDYTEDEKSVQISSYKDACYLMDSLSRDFGKLFDEGPNHDVEFTCGDETVKAHKNILCCRSSVFASMLQSDMVEGKTGRINIQDIDATIFQQFLRCLYTGILPELTVDSAFQFYEVSDKYGVDAVKKQCADFMIDNLSPENACEVLVLSDRHSDADFKQNVIQYVINEKIPYVGQKWADFCQENPVLAVEIYKLFCEQFRPK